MMLAVPGIRRVGDARGQIKMTDMNQPEVPKEPARSTHEKTLFRIMVLGTSVSFGILAAVIVSMKDFVRGNAAFEFSAKTVVAFVIGCAVGWLFWKWFRSRINRDKKQSGSD